MLAKREEVPEGEEEPSDRWSLVMNVITSYALSLSGIDPNKRNFLVDSQDEEEIRAALKREYPTIDFTRLPMAVYPLRKGILAALGYEVVHGQDVIEIDPKSNLYAHVDKLI